MSVLQLARRDLLDRVAYASAAAPTGTAVRLHCNENPWAPPHSPDPLINRYPEKQPPELVGQLANLYGVEPENVLMTRGADDAIDAVIRGFCRPGNDSVAHCPPTFSMYEFFARLHGVNLLPVPLNVAAGFAIDLDGLVRVADDGARILFLCSPNNPTGSVISRPDVLRLAAELNGKSLVVLDEAYVEFTDQPGLAGEVNAAPNLVVLRTMSKAWSLAGARLGVLIGHPELVAYLNRVALVPYPLPRGSIAAAVAALAAENRALARQRVRELIRRREQVRERLQQFRFVQRVWPSQANFLLLHVLDAARVVEACHRQGILVRDQSGQPGLDQHVRISIGSESEIRQLVETLRTLESDS